MWKQKHVGSIVYAFICLMMAACGGSDPVDVSGGIVGTVYDSNNNPLQGVAMTLTPLGKTTTTGQNGTYSFSDIDAGSYRVQARKSGYQEDTKSVNVSVGGNATLDFHLSSAAATLKLSQETLDFGNDNTTLTLDIKNTGSATLTWQISEDVSWLQCVPTSGSTVAGGTSSVIVNVDRTGLSRGNYSQTLAISSNGGSAVVKVNIGVQGLTVKVSPEELDFGPTTTSMQLTLTNTGTQSVSYTLTPSNEWIKPSKTSGMFTYGSDVITVAVDRTGKATGDYSGSLTLTIGEDKVTIPVRMNVPSKEKPTVTLNSVDNITYNTALLKGGIVSIGSQKVTKHGFCWDTKEQPVLGSGSSCNLGDCTTAKDFEYSVSQLQPGTKYYVRAYAENAEGISYSNQMSFETLEQPQKPVVETGAVSNILTSQAMVSGNILKIGNDAGITQYGHVWHTSAHPTTANNKTTFGATSSVGPFTSTLKDLKPHTTYHVRAYATNAIGTSYGDDVTFTTDYDVVSLTTINVTSITHSQATTGGSISDKGGHTIRERGVCWSTGSNPTTSSSKQVSTDNADRFSVRINGLTELTNYHVRAYVVTENGETYYGNDLSFRTTHEIKLAQSSKATISAITTNSATFRSTITSDGDGNISDCGFVYAKTSGPTVGNGTKVSCGKLQSGAFSKNITGLSDNTTYYVRSYVVNEAGTSYGEETNFATLEIVKPTVGDVTVGRVTYKSVSLSAKVTSLGNGTLTDAGFVYSTSPNPGMTNHKVSCGKTSDLSTKVSTLTPKTTYYVRAYATNEKGTTLGNETSFTTTEEPTGNNVGIDDYDDDKNWDK